MVTQNIGHSHWVLEEIMIYELRVYDAMPGRLPDLVARFKDGVVPLWEKSSIRSLGFWTTSVGKSNNQLTYMLAWRSVTEREEKWTTFQNDPAWHALRDRSEQHGPIVIRIENQLLTPTSFSELK